PQSKTEQLLTHHLASFGQVIEWGGELRSFVQDEDGVTVVLCNADGPEESVRVSYLIGCDGAHSTVRHTLGGPFAGTDYPSDYAVADVRIDWRGALSGHGSCFFFGAQGGSVFWAVGCGRVVCGCGFLGWR